MSKESIISNERKCAACGSTKDLQLHHIFYGSANRHLSDEDGLWVFLCRECHLGTNGVHNGNREIDEQLKSVAQYEWQRHYGSKEDFIKRYGKSVL